MFPKNEHLALLEIEPPADSVLTSGLGTPLKSLDFFSHETIYLEIKSLISLQCYLKQLLEQTCYFVILKETQSVVHSRDIGHCGCFTVK